MKSVLFFLAAVGLNAVAALTVVMAPPWTWAWKLAIGGAEYGHVFALLALAELVVGVAILRGTWRVAVVALAGCAMVAFLRPIVEAVRLSRGLPAQMQAAFGRPPLAEPPFRFTRLFVGTAGPSSPIATEIYRVVDGQELKLDFSRPAPADGRIPACVIVVHGGGWDAGDRAQMPALNRRLTSLGYAVASIDYRLSPRWPWPAPQDDLRAAIAWLKANAGRMGFDPGNLVLLGRSAGAQIVQVVGFADHDPAVRGIISFYGPSDLDFGYRHTVENDTIRSRSLLRGYLGGTPDEQPGRYRDASGLNFVDRRSPPTLLLHGGLDTLVWVRHDDRLAGRLREAGVPHFFLMLPWATHGFDFNPDGPGGQLADYAVRDFLAAVTTGPAPR
ncbi:MAG TPA: alpha/beta hydrolase [Candidatus Didemnitutus sp.]